MNQHLFKRLFHRRGIFSTTHVRKQTVPFDSYHEHYGIEKLDYLDTVEREAGQLP